MSDLDDKAEAEARDYGRDQLEKEMREVLRDRFAMAALTGLCTIAEGTVQNTAEAAYTLADAMLKARESTR